MKGIQPFAANFISYIFYQIYLKYVNI